MASTGFGNNNLTEGWVLCPDTAKGVQSTQSTSSHFFHLDLRQWVLLQSSCEGHVRNRCEARSPSSINDQWSMIN